ncbi:hypothetical protein LUW77_28435 [Streptomyces radiopugnans]|nr:hypothetical protein LUW77_28435 [Streptomyces radiopugnans]
MSAPEGTIHHHRSASANTHPARSSFPRDPRPQDGVHPDGVVPERSGQVRGEPQSAVPARHGVRAPYGR